MAAHSPADAEQILLVSHHDPIIRLSVPTFPKMADQMLQAQKCAIKSIRPPQNGATKLSSVVIKLGPSTRGGFMTEPRFEIGQEVHVAQDHCNGCKKLELQHPVSTTVL